MLASDTSTVKVTVISRGLLVASADATWTVKVYVPGVTGAPAVPVVAEKVTVAGAVVVLIVGVITEPPGAFELTSDTESPDSVPPPPFVTLTVPAVVPLPLASESEPVLELNVIDGASTLKVTVMDRGELVAAGESTLTVAV